MLKMETINVTRETKNEFDKEIMNLRIGEGRNIFADEFINMLLVEWRKTDDTN